MTVSDQNADIEGVRAGQLSALLARVEAAEGADHDIDRSLLLCFGWDPMDINEVIWRKGGMQIGLGGSNLTASLDAAVALVGRVFPGALIAVCDLPPNNPAGRHMSGLRAPGLETEAYGATRPLTLLGAMLKALLAQAARPTEPLSRSGRTS